jgi:hypothetical protein
MRDSAMWRRYSRAEISVPPNAVPYGLYVQQRNENSPARLVLEVARPLQVLEPLVERLVEADHHRRRRLQPGLDDRALRVEVVAHRVLPLACRLRKSSVRISLPPPVIQCTPASRSARRRRRTQARRGPARNTNSAIVSA